MRAHKILALLLMIIGTSAFSQLPQGISHQSVVRDNQNNLIVNHPVGVRVSILHGSFEGEVVYVETHNLVSNQNGLITMIIGEGNPVTGIFPDIDWSGGLYFLHLEVDPTGGDDYSISGTTQFLSVPYAMHAGSAETVTGLEQMIYNVLIEAGLVSLVADIDGNLYDYVTVGDQHWMVGNLRTTRYNDGSPIVTGLNDSGWTSTTAGAYTIFPYLGGPFCDGVLGIDSDDDMVAAYGKLYNWYAVNDPRGLCPEGWRVPSDEDWTNLTNFLIAGYGYITALNVGNRLKSCRQVNSPALGDCNVEEHPRWNEHNVHYGTDDFGFYALPGGMRSNNGVFLSIGLLGYWWTSTEFSDVSARAREMSRAGGRVIRDPLPKSMGLSVRCVRDAE